METPRVFTLATFIIPDFYGLTIGTGCGQRLKKTLVPGSLNCYNGNSKKV
jgi:hypothetical protein